MIEKGATHDEANDDLLEKFVKWIPEEELVPFYNLPHLSSKLKIALGSRIEEYRLKTRRVSSVLSICLSEHVIRDIISHVIIHCIRHKL